jgi:alpha-tubulin suppressor-like RCC1 family protein
MFKKIVISVLTLAIIASSSNAFAISGEEGKYFYRYKTGLSVPQIPDTQTKDIVAYYIGGIGKAFTEKLPMKPQWQDDDWRITKGNLPAGLSFDNSDFTFAGSPTETTANRVVELAGYDANGTEVATAEVHFDIYQLPDSVVDVDFYAHLGKFSSNALQLPSNVTIFGDPKLLSAAPGGITYNARYFEGTPTKAGRYPVIAMGYDYLGKAVVAFSGYYTVTDGPVFDTVADDIRQLTYNQHYGCGYGSECAIWDLARIQKIERAITDASKVRYYVETENDAPLPNGLSIDRNVYNPTVSGYAFNYYDQTKVRYKAIDTDGTVGYSNWFKLGTGGPAGVCQPVGAATIPLYGTVGTKFLTNGYRIPSGLDNAAKTYTVVTGALPAGLTLNPSSGLISGTPTDQETKAGVKVEIAFADASANPSFICGPYDFNISAAPFTLSVSGSKVDYRIHEAFAAKATAAGGLIAPYKIELDPSSMLPQGVSYDASSGTFSGKTDTVGVFNAVLKLTNGDGSVKVQTIAFTVHDNLAVDPVTERPSIAQYETTNNLLTVSVDQTTVIGNAVVDLIGGPLPAGFSFDGFSMISGGTQLPPLAGDYGPFSFHVSDSTGQSVDSNQFWIKVKPRADIVASATDDPLTYTVDWADPGKKPFSVTQPPLAQNYLPLQYQLNGPELPNGLSFSTATGYLYGTPTEKTSVSGFTITIKEISPDNLQKTSTPFTITVNDPPMPSDVAVPAIVGNVSGPRIASIPPLGVLGGQAQFIMGGLQSVKFLTAEPSVPGLTFDQATGTISGNPTAEFSGNVTITYEDKKQRQGHVVVPVSIFPYPTAAASQNVYEVPRLSTAAGISVSETNTGFYQGVNWGFAPGSDALPTGMKLSGNQITGKTSDAVGTVRNIILRGTSIANGLIADAAFSIKIVDQAPLEFKIPTTLTLGISLDPDSGDVVKRDVLSPKTYLSGSYVNPVTFTLQNQPSWLSMSDTGALGGKPPAVGDFTSDIVATDNEGESASSSFKIHVTLAGDITIVPGQGGSKTVRIGESFKTAEQTVSKAIAPWTAVPNTPDGLTFDSSNLTYTGSFDQMAGNSASIKWNLQITDTHGRTLAKPGSTYQVDVVNRLKIATPATVSAKQYSTANPVLITIPTAENQIGSVGYSIEGALPGTLYYKGRDQLSGRANFTQFFSDGSSSVTVQLADETVAQTVAKLAKDHIIFDSEAMTISGVPSKIGTFPVRITALDSHQLDYWKMADATRESYNTASTNLFNIVVDAPDSLLVKSTVNPKGVVVPGGNANVTLSAANDAYGEGVTWLLVSSTLPSGITYSIANGVVTFSGYSTAVGTYTVNFKATDTLGRVASLVQTFKVFISTDPIILNVANIKTKVGYPAQMVSPFAATPLSTGNTFGPVDFYSNTLPQITGITLNRETGFIDGLFTTPQQFSFDLYATDDTNRITSKPVTVEVIPNLRVIVPATILADPYVAVNQTISTDYKLGTVTYEIDNPAAWPDGFSVDKTTGKVVAPAPLVAPLGEYPGLKIKATDTFGTFTDVQPSSSFTVRIEANGPYVRLLDKTFTDLYKRVAYSYDFTKSAEFLNAGASEFTWSMTNAGVKLPPGLTISAAGVLSGTPTESGSFDINVTARYKSNSAIYSTKKYTLVIGLPQSSMAVNTTTMTAPRSQAYSFDFKTITDVTNIDTSKIVYTYTVVKTGQQFPAGMTLNSSGVISGTPTKKGSFQFTVVATFTDGNPTAETYTASADVVFIGDAPSYKYVDVAVGFNHACGATEDGLVLCWGDNANGQLGDNTRVAKVYPTQVVGITDARKVIAGYYNTCAITVSGAMKCWGYNGAGQLGDGTTVDKLTPVQVVGMTSGVTGGAMLKYSSSPYAPRSCAIQNGGMWCWGSDSYGGLGNAASLSSLVPVQPVGLSSGVTSIGLEYITTHVGMSDGSLRAWGWNGENRLGTNKAINVVYETPLTLNTTDAKQTLGYSYLSTAGTVRNLSNNVGTAAVAAYGSDNIQAAEAGGVICTTKSSGNVYCSTVGTVVDASSISKVDVGPGGSACGVRQDEVVLCWGPNGSGQLGDGTKTTRNNAVPIE